MFARGVVSLHTLPHLGRKPSSVKSRVSTTSKLIETKGLQVFYFGHLRKTGGERELPAGTYCLSQGPAIRKRWGGAHSELWHPTESVAPTALELSLLGFPALTHWAKVCRASGA